MVPEYAMPRKLWENPNPEESHMWKFQTSLENATGDKFPDFYSLYDFSCKNRTAFWRHAFQYFPIVYSGTIPDPVVDESARIDSNPRWFEGVRINFAQNILFVGDRYGRPVLSPGKEDNKIACTEVREGAFLEPIKHIRWKELREKVGILAQAMRDQGIKKGDRVAVVASTSIDTLIVFLAVTSIGGLFSSSSTDMGSKGILDRLVQVKPRYLFMDDWAVYNGKRVDLRPKMRELVEGMKAVVEFEGIVSQARFEDALLKDISSVANCQTLASFISTAKSSELVFEQVDFNDPFLIVYSSGTTGQPKCIVHRVGGVVLNGHKEGQLHRGIDHTSTELQYTSTGWIMYLVSVQALLGGARMVLYDGNPFIPNLQNFVKLLGEQKVTHFGTSPRYLQTLHANDIIPRVVTNLSSLRVLTSTGMVLSDALFEWVYDVGFPPSIQLNNLSGGTDLAGAFGIGNPILPVYVGGCQGMSLGYAVEVFDQTLEGGIGFNGVPVDKGTPGELVCTAAFPTMPIMFLGENGPQKYFDSYFARFDNVWTHGDLIMVHPVTKHILFLGRADGGTLLPKSPNLCGGPDPNPTHSQHAVKATNRLLVLNPSGVRFGSAEIYNILETKFSDEISDSICVGQRRPNDNDESVMLFLMMKPNRKFTHSLVTRVREAIRKETSPRHVPKYVFETPEIPTTINLKKVELPVKQIVSGKTVIPSGTLLNPQSLDYYYQFAMDERLAGGSRAKL